MPVTSKDLLDHLSDLQLALEDYSFEKMTVEEASAVKKSYDHFRNQLETCIWGGPVTADIPEHKPAQTKHIPYDGALSAIGHDPVSYTHLTLPTKVLVCSCRWWGGG